MQLATRLGAFILGLLVAGVAAAPTAAAPSSDEGSGSTTTTTNSVILKADKHRRTPPGRDRHDNSSSHTASAPHKSAYELKVEAWQRQVAAITARNLALGAQWDQCVRTSGDYGCGQYLAGTQALPGRPTAPPAGKGQPVPVVAPIPPQVIAYEAVAELKLRAPRPLIGPDPALNKWDTAVVGYPLWLAVDGDTTPPPVSDTVYDISVSLQAHLSKVVFSLGDGHRVTCTGTQVTHPWTTAVATNAVSPWCGYTYQSIPKGSKTYTVTANAYWSVDWQINGATGTLPFYQSTSIQLPVSELQVLTR